MSFSGFQQGAVLNVVSFGLRPESVEVPYYANRAPASTDTRGNGGAFPLGKQWLFVGDSLWYLLSFSTTNGIVSANWIQVIGSSGNIISILGTANQITATTVAGVTTLSIPATFIAPGSIASTTTIAAGTALSSGTTITAGTSITATLGNITATNGNFVASTAGTGLLLNPTVASGAASGTVAANGRVVSVTFTGVSIAAGATQAFTTSNTSITGSGTVLHISMVGSTSGAALNIQSVVNSASQSVITVENGTGATTTTANITFTYFVLN